jgi:hypothetical protein
VDRLRCSHCRNPIKPHHLTSGPAAGDRTFHEDCWAEAQAQTVASRIEQQLDYQRRIAAEGLVALLSPYVSVFPQQREGTSTPVAV